MKARLLLITAFGTSVLTFSACSSSAGRGAAIDAGTGAIVGARIGAALGAGAGALIGASVDEKRAARSKPPPVTGYPVAVSGRAPNMYYSPYTHKLYNLSQVPSGGLVQDADTQGYFRKP